MKEVSPEKPVKDELIACFPEWKEIIEKIYPLNKNFREVSADYIYCKYEIASLSQRAEESSRLRMEYESTMKDLEEEIMEYIDIKTT